MRISFVRSSVLLLSFALLSACGSTSKLQRSAASQKSLADYSTVYVADFSDATNKRIKNPDKAAAFKASVTEAQVAFADMIGTNIEKTKNAPSVVRQPPEGEALRIEGEITKLERGNAALRLLLPLAGSTQFNANVRFVDQQTGEVIGKIVVDKNSNPLGGGYAATQTTRRFMGGAAEKVAEQLELARAPAK